ncbi:MAG: acyl-CoA dehydrogenase C-terminal domain-containing protein, partial [Gammaproteobacteria bacterium]|nr:acyl-CoA dehydrogenase C-terminal domain-containing protein [Gammaproteobacteria bacterium]
RSAAVSIAALHKGGADADFYRAKLSTARFYFARLLPRAEAHLDALSAGSRTLMDLPEGQFVF